MKAVALFIALGLLVALAWAQFTLSDYQYEDNYSSEFSSMDDDGEEEADTLWGGFSGTVFNDVSKERITAIKFSANAHYIKSIQVRFGNTWYVKNLQIMNLLIIFIRLSYK